MVRISEKGIEEQAEHQPKIAKTNFILSPFSRTLLASLSLITARLLLHVCNVPNAPYVGLYVTPRFLSMLSFVRQN